MDFHFNVLSHCIIILLLIDYIAKNFGNRFQVYVDFKLTNSAILLEIFKYLINS